MPHCALHCIVPPYMLRAIARNGTPEQRREALAALGVDREWRALRVAARPPPTGVPAVALAQVAVPRPRRTVYDAGGGQQLPGRPVRREGSAAVRDVAVNEAYDGLGATFDFLLAAYGRNSIDGAGMPLDASVHFGVRYDNAFWDGRQMVFGDGDGRLFNRFTVALDVIGHELAHGLTAAEAALAYRGQSGALNESMSDVFGTLVRQFASGQNASQGDWLIGAGLLAPGIRGVALRSMKQPGTAYDDPVLGRDPQPAHMNDYVRTRADSGGVHINSGIPNRAFYLAATGIGGRAWERAGRVWYETLCDRKLKPTTTFAAFARATVGHAAQLYTATGRETRAIVGAWREVGVLP